MSQYNGMTLTVAGLQLLTKAVAGIELKFTRVALGDGQLPQDKTLSMLTNLVDWKLDLPITSLSVTGTGTASMQAVLQNKNLATGFFAREIGIYATDPDAGEILYAVANAGDSSDFIPAGGGADVVELILEVITVVGQASSVSATLNTSLLFATQVDLNSHINDPNTHVNLLQWGAAITRIKNVIVQQADGRTLNTIDFDDFKKSVLGGDGTDITNMRGQIDQVEREQANIALQLAAQKIYPDYNALLAENFNPTDNVDQFSCQITGVAAGDDSLDLATLSGIVPGAWYTVSDGVNQEAVQIKSIVKNGTTLRAICMSAIVNTYVTSAAILYRTTAEIDTGAVQGAGGRSAAIWQPTTTWSGVNANNPITASLNTSQSNAAAFTITGSIAFTSDNMATLA